MFSDFKSLGNSKYGLYGIFFFTLQDEKSIFGGLIIKAMKKLFPPKSGKWHLEDFTLSNARRFYLSMGSPLGLKGLKLKRFLLALSGKTLLVTVKEITK